ncbi:MAG: hypothetical protein M0P71_06760, partial [Melioribacteraceae bacterium]|nr:hypothetical protein [Melioribacteraceae bacterium]
AFSPKDVWLVCYSDVARGLIWHYDGKTWRESNIYADLGGMRVNGISGSSSSDIWAVGYSGTKSFIGHYNGIKWTRYAEEFNDQLLDITKDDEGNFWACGRNGIILKYTNGKWEQNYFKVNYNLQKEQYFYSGIAYYNKKLHLLGRKIPSGVGQTEYHIVGEFNNWAIIDSQIYSENKIIKFGNWKFINIDNKLYSYGSGGAWKYGDNEWIHFFHPTFYVKSISGLNEDYMLAVGAGKNLYFYNGNSWNDYSNILKKWDNEGFLSISNSVIVL